MNQTYNRDIKYSFLKRCVKPYQTSQVDEDWIKEKNIEMDIIIPFKNISSIEDVLPKSELNGWSDVGIDEILGRNLCLNDFNIK